MKYDLKKSIFLVKKFYEFKNITLVQRAYKAEYKEKIASGNKVIENIVSNFEKNGSVTSSYPKTRKSSGKREDAKKQIESMIAEFPNLSIRKMSSASSVSTTLVFHILHDDLHLKPYKYHDWHKLEVHDYDKRLEFAQWFLKLPLKAKFFFICTDEAYFYLTIPINKQNNRLWSDSCPYEGIETPLQDEKVLVWCAISAEKIYGPYFFSESVNQYNYLSMLKNYFWPKLIRTKESNLYYFQQDGATPHTANNVQTWLTTKFGSKFVNKKMWPPRSPDLNPCDYYLWGYLKSKVYNPLPKNLDELKENISNEVRKITKETLNSVFLNLEKRCNLIISAQGGHIE